VQSADDKDIIIASQAGDQQAMSRLISLHASAVHGFILSMINDRAAVEDIAQETFIRAFLAIGKYEFRAPFRSWLFRIALNQCRDHLRKVKVRSIIHPFKRSADDTEIEYADPGQNALQQLIQDERSRALHAALQRLPESLRQVLVLRDLQEYSYEEIAALLHWRMGTVKSRLFRARKELANRLKPYLEENREKGS